MECNKDEAMRAKEIAEKKLLERDIHGAKKFALKAQSLFPELDGLSRFLDIINVHVAHELKINGEPDYYGILGVDILADDDTLKKKYKKLALSLHPDKSNLAGADEAFKIMSQAWNVLSDKGSRSAYNFRRILQQPIRSGNVGSTSASRTASATNTQPAPAPQRNMGTSSATNTQSLHTPQMNQGTAPSQQGTYMNHQKNAGYVPSYYSSRGFQQTPAMSTAAGAQYHTVPSHFRQPTHCTTAKHTAADNLPDSSAPNIQSNPTQGSSRMSMNSATSVPSQSAHPRKYKKPSAQATPVDSNQPAPSEKKPCSRPEIFWTFCNSCKLLYSYNKIYQNQTLLCIWCEQAFSAVEVPNPTSKVGLHLSTPRFRRTDMFKSRKLPAWVTGTSQGDSTLPSSGTDVKRMNEDVANMAMGNEAETENRNTATEQMEAASSAWNAASSGLNRANLVKRKRADGLKGNTSKDGLEGTAEKVEPAADSAPNKEKPRKKRRVTENRIEGNAEKLEAGSNLNVVSSGLSTEKPMKGKEKDGLTGGKSKDGIGGSAKNNSGHKKKSEKPKGDFGAGKHSNAKDLFQNDLRAMLMKRAKMEIVGQLTQWKTEKEKKEAANTQEPVNVLKNDFNNHTRTQSSGFSDPKATLLQPKKSSSLKEVDGTDVNLDETVSMAVPDANFHNFDDDRVENSFSENQVWAAYDSADGMPRFYALVQHVVSQKPFKLEISWLDANSTSEFGPLDWLGYGFTKTIGDFKLAKSVINKRLNSFSHPVKWRKGPRGVIQISPEKGDVWALYKNWSHDWNEATADEVIRKYDMVEVLDDYSINEGILVAPLVKVAGFTTVFSQIPEQRLIWKIPKDEMFRFSHQVPFFRLNGIEDTNVPKGCYELDPAALPLELLKVITEAEAAEAAEERVSELHAMLREREAPAKSTSAGNTCATDEGGSVEETKQVVMYSRRKKGRKIEGGVDQSDGQTSLDES